MRERTTPASHTTPLNIGHCPQLKPPLTTERNPPHCCNLYPTQIPSNSHVSTLTDPNLIIYCRSFREDMDYLHGL